MRLTVQDVGVGFDPDAMDKLFQSFYTTKNDGMGMGLSISRSIVESHKGRLWARRNDGPGATFCIFSSLRTARVTSRSEAYRQGCIQYAESYGGTVTASFARVGRR